MRAAFTNRGAQLSSWQLKDYLEDGEPVELLPRDLPPSEPAPFSLELGDEQLTHLANTGLYRASDERLRPTDESETLVFDYEDAAGLRVRKTFRFDPPRWSVSLHLDRRSVAGGAAAQPGRALGPGAGRGRTLVLRLRVPPRAARRSRGSPRRERRPWRDGHHARGGRRRRRAVDVSGPHDVRGGGQPLLPGGGAAARPGDDGAVPRSAASPAASRRGYARADGVRSCAARRRRRVAVLSGAEGLRRARSGGPHPAAGHRVRVPVRTGGPPAPLADLGTWRRRQLGVLDHHPDDPDQHCDLPATAQTGRPRRARCRSSSRR